MASRGNPLRVVTDLAERAYEEATGVSEAGRRQSAWTRYCMVCINERLVVTGAMRDLMAYYRVRYGDVLK